MAQTEDVNTRLTLDNKDVIAKFDDFERRIKNVENRARNAGKGIGAAMGAAIGGVAGFVAGTVANNPATNAITDLLVSVLAAGMLPLLQEMLPIIKVLGPIMAKIAEKLGIGLEFLVDTFGADTLARAGIGAYIGGRVAGPAGAVVGGTAAAALPPYVDQQVKQNEAIIDFLTPEIHRMPEGAQSSANTYQGTGSPQPVNVNHVYGPRLTSGP